MDMTGGHTLHPKRPSAVVRRRQRLTKSQLAMMTASWMAPVPRYCVQQSWFTQQQLFASINRS
jgi:hypothetical protein